MTKDCFKIFIKHFEQETRNTYGNKKVLMIVDGASNHQDDAIESKRIILQKLPAACPELNPVERFFEQLRTELSNRVFENLDQVENYMIQILQKYYKHPELICSLTHFKYIRH